jgi:beta-xylosidase
LIRFITISACLLIATVSFSQKPDPAWRADNGDGTYTNPVLHADYSDPDVVRVNNNYYMVASSFEDVPGLPILHSRDLVNWKLIGHAIPRLVPEEHYSVTRHGEGVWAPSIRFRNGEFLIYYPDPDFGIYLTKAKDPAGPWTKPVLVEGGKGLIDPCPLWDDDGNVYLVHAYAGSRAGIKSILVVKKLNKAGDKVIDNGVIVYDGHETDPTVEGPKLYKRNGWYYIFAPAGGVSTGWQLVLRSKNIYGPYDRKVVMDQGKTTINGPHQGAWVNTVSGEHWFIHFQDKGAYGRVVHLQPMKWINDWPVIGNDADGDSKGEPVTRYRKPESGGEYHWQVPADTDEFNGRTLGLQWQWTANPKVTWIFSYSSEGKLRLYSEKVDSDLWKAPNILQQKFPAEQFTATTKLSFQPAAKLENEQAGLIVLGLEYAAIGIRKKGDKMEMFYRTGNDKNIEETFPLSDLPTREVYLRVSVVKGGKCRFSYSTDGRTFIDSGQVFTAKEGKWKGARLGIYCIRDGVTNDSGYADFDWFRVEGMLK